MRINHVTQTLEFISVQAAAQIAQVASLALQIWPEHYVPIIGQAQVDYMLARYQSEPAIAQQVLEGDEYFLLRHQQQWLGYAAVRSEPAERSLFISKLYLLHTVRRQGLGRAGLLWLARLAHERGFNRLWLTVNKHNPALLAYLRIGFVNVGAVVTDIGAGFVMDDYRLEWTPAGL